MPRLTGPGDRYFALELLRYEFALKGGIPLPSLRAGQSKKRSSCTALSRRHRRRSRMADGAMSHAASNARIRSTSRWGMFMYSFVLPNRRMEIRAGLR